MIRGAAASSALLLALTACGYRVADTGAPAESFFEGASSIRANAAIRDSRDQTVGLATFRDTRLGVLVEVAVTGLPPGSHGIHVHAVGKCDRPEFMTAGADFNPNAAQHGIKNPRGPHAGDLPNLIVDEQGKGRLSYVNPFLSLEPGASNSAVGLSIVIHANADDEITDPAGNSGGRIACGLISRFT